MVRPRSWHNRVFFGIHYDLHAGAKDTALGKDLTPEHLRERLILVQPDWIQCDCKGHAGYTSWPTKVGSTSPGMVIDALRIHRDVTRRLGIKLGMHYSGVWDSRAIELHPDWARLDENGKPDPNSTCPLGGYTEKLMIPQMLELIDSYDVDGFWVDGENWASHPCWCPRCQAEFVRRTGSAGAPQKSGEPNWQRWLAFHRELFVEHVVKYAKAVHARKPSCAVCSNWMYTVRQPDPVAAPVDYLSGDFDPSWGASRAALEGRVLDARGITWDLMAWGFATTGDWWAGGSPPWCTKTETHLCQEISEVLALGGAVMVYFQPQRTGWLTRWHHELLGKAARFCRARKDVCFRTRSASQAAVLHLASHLYANADQLFQLGVATQPLEGALHALLETGRSADVLPEEQALARMRRYKLIVVPEQTHLTAKMKVALENFARAGGRVFMTGAHLAREMPDLVGASPLPPAEGVDLPQDNQAVYLPVGNEAVGVGGPWQPVLPKPGTWVLACRLSEQDPGKNATYQAVATRRPLGRGCILAVHGPIFRDYYLAHFPRLRRFIADLIAGLNLNWSVEVEAPPQLEMVLRRKPRKLLVNLINRGSAETLSPQRAIVEELPAVRNVVLRIRRNRRPKAVRLDPGHERLRWSFRDGVVTVTVPRVAIHNVVVVEW